MTNHPVRVLVAVAALAAAISAVGADDPPGGKSRAPFRSRAVPKERPQSRPGAPAPAAPAPAQTSGDSPLVTRLPEAVRRAPAGPPMEVAPIDRARRPEVNAAAALIDDLIDRASPAAARAEDAPLDDALFARRVYLNLGGRIPSAQEMVAFMGSKSPRRREELVDAVLASPDWVSHAFNLWADTLRLRDAAQFPVYAWPYLDWVKRSIALNRPYDQWVRAMLTADGRPWENPAVGFQLRDLGMPLNYVDHTVRVFLGTQIGCAQCHDHPFDDWKQREFYEIAAFTAGTRAGVEQSRSTRRGGTEPPSRTRLNLRDLSAEYQKMLVGKPKEELPFMGHLFMQHLRANALSIDHGPHDLQLPQDYRSDDGRPGEVIDPQVPWGEVPDDADGLDPRARFAAWLTSPDNRPFARTVANRLWKECFGVGIVEPVDDFREGNPPSHPELLEHLADLIVELGFDTREFVRVVVSTKAWQRRAVSHDPTSATPFAFRAPVLRRMTAEQLWDSILTLIARDIWAYQRPPYEAYDLLGGFDLSGEGADLATAIPVFERFQKTLSQHAIDQRLRHGMNFFDVWLARASELPQPSLAGSFLREFGQGDRETIDGRREVATLPQVLTMLHGNHGRAIIDDGSAIMQALLANDPDRAIDVAFIGILSRPPDDADRETVTMVLRSAPTALEGFRDIVWALVNTREFLFVQ